jgi:hypothetical protein
MFRAAAHPEPSSDPSLRHVGLRYFLIALVPVAVFVSEILITQFLMAQDVHVPLEVLRPGDAWLEAAGRYQFLAATWIFAAVSVLAVCLLLRRLAQPMTPATRKAALAVWAAILALAISPTVLDAFGVSGTPIYGRLGVDVFEAALSRGMLPGCGGPADTWLLGKCGEIPAIALFERVLDLINLLAGLAVGAQIANMILCLDARPTAGVEDEAALLAENLRDMRQQLYVSSVLLTFGMLFAASWMHWPLPMITDEARPGYATLVRASALFIGVYFTLLLLSFYLPVSLILTGRARALATRARGRRDTRTQAKGQDAGGGFDPDAWLADHGLKEGAGDYLRAGFALAAPVLSAFAGGLAPVPL